MFKNFFQNLLRLMGKIFLKIFFRLEVEGIEKIPKQGPLILISNHHSYLDPPVIVSTFPRRIHFVAKKELFLHPLTSLFVKLFDSIPVDRGHTKPSTFKTIFRYLSNQEVICIFPEGTRVNNPENFGKAERGIGFIVSKSQAPVLITYIDGTYQWYKKFKIKVIFKELVTFEQLSKIEESKIPEFLMKKVYHDKN